MPLIKRHAFLIPRGTSAHRVEPAYVKPLLQLLHDTKEGDRSKHVQQLSSLPPGIPKKAAVVDVSCEGEMQRLCAEFGLKAFRTVDPIDDMFAKAFAACQTDALPGETNAVPVVERNTDDLIADFLALNVPSLSKDKAKALVDAGATDGVVYRAVDPVLTQGSGLRSQPVSAGG